ncbi:MAG TPA: hypothetical protein VEG62_06190 [Acidimicrobiales bacterium]|nr:hypothetical protein [Acidimicrobiales bacterium]
MSRLPMDPATGTAARISPADEPKQTVVGRYPAAEPAPVFGEGRVREAGAHDGALGSAREARRTISSPAGD